MARPPDPILAALRSQPVAVTRSPLAREVRARFDELSKLFGGGMVDWSRVAQVFGEHGIRDQAGKAPSGDAVRKAFARERLARQLAAERALARPQVPGKQPGELVPGVRPVAASPADAAPATAPEGEPREPHAAESSAEATAVIARLRKKMDKRSGR